MAISNVLSRSIFMQSVDITYNSFIWYKIPEKSSISTILKNNKQIKAKSQLYIHINLNKIITHT